MLYRSIRKVDTGQWVDVLFAVAGSEFSVTEESHRTEIAAALGLLPAELETVDADSDQREGALLDLPTPPQAPLTRIQELLAIPRSDWTTAQIRELLQLAAQQTLS